MPLIDLPPWQSQELRVPTWEEVDGKRVSASRLVLAKVLGPVAIHPSLRGEGWTVAPVVVGLKACDVDDEEEAKKVGEVLYRHCRLAFLAKTQAEVLAKLPGWVKPWLMACRGAGRCLNPAPYKLKGGKS